MWSEKLSYSVKKQPKNLSTFFLESQGSYSSHDNFFPVKQVIFGNRKGVTWQIKQGRDEHSLEQDQNTLQQAKLYYLQSDQLYKTFVFLVQVGTVINRLP